MRSENLKETEQKKIIPHERTNTRLWVDEAAALRSSLKELGDGIVISNEFKSRFEEVIGKFAASKKKPVKG